jgi:lipopolysaccharide/colanic/teichoic acid biosynthesis glycosyltransferase
MSQDQLPALYLGSPAGRSWHLCQRALALVALLALTPLFALLWLAVRLSSPGPFLFRQQRRGLAGRPFTIYKIRTLRTGTERSTALGVTSGNSSITSVGRVLRELKLDELPQLWNIVTGDMEFVGPRPIPLALEEELSGHLPAFRRRHALRPGLTNVAQVSILDNRIGADLLRDWSRRFEGELHCLGHKSVSYDLLVIAMTVTFLFRKVARRLAPQPAPKGAVS